MSTGAERIKAWCQAWLGAATIEGGGLQIGQESERWRLLANNVVFHELDHDEMRAASLGLSAVLLMPGLNTVIDWDHKWFWSWCGELLCGSVSTYFGAEERELKNLMSLCVRASLAGVYRPDEAGWEKQRDMTMSMEPNARDWVQNSHGALAYLAFPLLEGVLKKHCKRFVTMDGVVLKTFVVPGKDRDKKYKLGKPCSSVRDLLWLFYREIASDEVRCDLDEQREHLAAFRGDQPVDGFDVLYRWRNSSLHGAASLPTIGGTVLNTLLLVALGNLREDFDNLRASTIERIRWELQSTQLGSGYRSSWSYYPPYL